MKYNGHYHKEVTIIESEQVIEKFGSSSHGLGDTLLLTIICKYLPNKLTIQLPKNKENYKILFDKLAKIEITNEINVIKDDFKNGNHAQRRLESFFGKEATKLDSRPVCHYTDKESEQWSENFLTSIKNPVIVCPFAAKEWSKIRDIPKDHLNSILKTLESKGKTPIIIQNEESHWNFPTLTNLALEKLICLIRQVGTYIGANTGLYHLAVAVGANVICYQPNDSEYFAANDWEYNHPSIKYVTWAK